jgi:pimeloyl-ACP methyl ester carboxylesterase
MNDAFVTRRAFVGAACVAALSTRFDQGRAQPPTPSGAIERRVRSSDGVLIGFLELGRGPRLVIVHGSLGVGDEWLPVAEKLAERYTCLVMDRRGRGRSTDAAAYSLDAECADIKAVLEYAGRNASILGHSYGAICVLETVTAFGVGKVALYEPPFPISASVVPDTEFDAFRNAVAAGNLAEGLVAGLRDIVHVPEQQLAELQSTASWDQMIPLAPTWVRELEVVKNLRLGVARFAAMKSPTLLLVGTETAPHHIEASDALQRTLADARTVRLPGQGHDAHLFVVDEFARHVSDFLAEP